MKLYDHFNGVDTQIVWYNQQTSTHHLSCVHTESLVLMKEDFTDPQSIDAIKRGLLSCCTCGNRMKHTSFEIPSPVSAHFF